MRLGIVVVAVFALSGCAQQREAAEAERNAPDLSFEGPLRPLTLSSAQIKLVERGIAESLKDPGAAKFGNSYRAGISSDRETAVCGFVNGKRFVGMFAKPVGGAMEFLPIKVAVDEEEQDAVREYCRANGIYLPR